VQRTHCRSPTRATPSATGSIDLVGRWKPSAEWQVAHRIDSNAAKSLHTGQANARTGHMV